MRQRMSIRDRLLTALDCRRPGRVPCSFMIFAALRSQCRSEEEFARRQLELGLDPFVHLGHLPLAFHPAVTTSVSKDRDPQGAGCRLRKTYATPAGDLTAVVRQTEPARSGVLEVWWRGSPSTRLTVRGRRWQRPVLPASTSLGRGWLHLRWVGDDAEPPSDLLVDCVEVER